MAAFEEGQVGGVERAEAGDGAPTFGSGPAQGVECGDAFVFQWRSGHGLQVALVGGHADLEVAVQVADAFSKVNQSIHSGPSAAGVWDASPPIGRSSANIRRSGALVALPVGGRNRPDCRLCLGK